MIAWIHVHVNALVYDIVRIHVGQWYLNPS